MANSIVIGDLEFTKLGKDTYSVLDLTYEFKIGVLRLQEGPGWVLEQIGLFLDYGHLKRLAEFMEIMRPPGG